MLLCTLTNNIAQYLL